MNNKITPTEVAIAEALKNPNGWVYVLDKAFEGTSEVPKEAVKGAWKVSSDGKIVGNFIPNPNYKPLNGL